MKNTSDFGAEAVPNRRIAYIISQELASVSSLLPANRDRSMIVHSLIDAFGLLKANPNVIPLRPERATKKDLAAYHTNDYLEYVLDEINSKKSNSEFGLEDDCPPFNGLPRYMCLVAGASLTATKALMNSFVDVSICWDGGRHHARKAQASGFCYVADVILSILALKRATPTISLGSPSRKPRIMYVDIDLHFCDAISEAFSTQSTPSKPSQIMILSIHHAAPGFFPAHPLAELPSGEIVDPFNLSIPLKAGASSSTLRRMWAMVEAAKDAFQPDYSILQCGTDGLSGDPCSIFNYSLDGMGYCVSRFIQDSWVGKKVLLGGGGYHSANTARAWTYFTSIAADSPLALDSHIPDHYGFPLYSPSFTLDVPEGNMQDQNTDQYLITVERHCEEAIIRMREILDKA